MVHFTPRRLYLNRAGLDEVEKRKKFFPCGESNPGRPTRSLVTILFIKKCNVKARTGLNWLWIGTRGTLL
jgi:hypothetical protein